MEFGREKIFDWLKNNGSWRVGEFSMIVSPYKGFPPNNGMSATPFGVVSLFYNNFERVKDWYLYDHEEFEDLMSIYDEWSAARSEGLISELINQIS